MKKIPKVTDNQMKKIMEGNPIVLIKGRKGYKIELSDKGTYKYIKS